VTVWKSNQVAQYYDDMYVCMYVCMYAQSWAKRVLIHISNGVNVMITILAYFGQNTWGQFF
jgi:hypothetical protein